MELNILRINNSTDLHFVKLVKLLDAELAIRDGKDHAFYAQFNTIDKLNLIVIAVHENDPVACGAMKKHAEGTMEIKRMYTAKHVRGRGVATMILKELEQWARELNYSACILETGIRQPEAISLYEKNGYARIPNYGQYSDVVDSVCFMKKLGLIE